MVGPVIYLLLCTLLRGTLLICSNDGRRLWSVVTVKLYLVTAGPNQKNIYGAALALIAIMYGSMQGIIAVTSLLATMHNPGNGMDPQ